MYNQSCDDYIRSILGYPNTNSQEYFQECNGYGCNMHNPYNYNYNIQNDYDYGQNRNSELEDCYPEIYSIVYPMVKKACQNMTGAITKDEVNRIADEIYTNIEGNDLIYLNINLNNNIENLNSVQIENRNENSPTIENTREIKENRMFNGKKVIEEPKPLRTANATNRTLMEDSKRLDRNFNEKNATGESNRENRGGQEVERETRQFNNGLNDLIRILLIRELLGRPNRPGNRPPFPPQGRPPFPPPTRPVRPPYNRDFGDIYEY